ncbi:MAG: non-canonical purine NTP pyrophosphatase [Treponema sp.]|nr:non-canonical purine NTP pyrophosphatase [Treponema sp.]
MNIWFATNNTHKKTELQAIMNTCLKIPSEEGISFDPDEYGTTFNENALIKARELKKYIPKDDIVIADDSGLCVDALCGRPGVLSARYGMENGRKLASGEQNKMLIEEVGDNNKIRTARFVCAMVLLFTGDRYVIVQETIEGCLVKSNEIKGEGGFGYDPIFFLPQFSRTLAQLSAEEKNAISHRGKAGKIIAEIILKKCQN